MSTRMMDAIKITKPGGPDVLEVVKWPVPEPAADEVLVAVEAAGVNRPDLLQRMGRYPPPAGASELPGLEIAGRVVATGDGVRRWKNGDAVCALVSGGGYATYCTVPEVQCLPIPPGLSIVQAGGLPETFLTVWTNVFERGRLMRGETLLVHGGASGIGTTAIQLGRVFGARVFATAGTPAKCAACERLGAERAINYRTEDFVAVLKGCTGGRGADVILDMVGGDYVARNLEVLAIEGRLVQIAVLRGAKCELDLFDVMRRRLSLTGSTLRARSAAEKGAIAQALEQHVWPHLASGAIAPVVHATFPLSRAADAHRALEAGDHIGKIVLTMPSTLWEPPVQTPHG